MEVYFNGNFWGHPENEPAGTIKNVEKRFMWAGENWRIPAIYVCESGIVVDFCVEIPVEKAETFFEKWTEEERLSELTDEQYEEMERENPYSLDVSVSASADGVILRSEGSCSVGWNPCAKFAKYNEEAAYELLAAYACDRNTGWKFIRANFAWSQKGAKNPEILLLKLETRAMSWPGIHFETERNGSEKVLELVHPLTKKKGILRIAGCQEQCLSESAFAGLQVGRARAIPPEAYPRYYQILEYTVDGFSKQEFQIMDCGKSDTPGSGPTAIFVAGKSADRSRQTACSAVHFEPVERIEWRTVFFEKPREDIRVELKWMPPV